MSGYLVRFLAVGIGIVSLAAGRAAMAGPTFGASVSISLSTSGGAFDGQWTSEGPLTTELKRFAINDGTGNFVGQKQAYGYGIVDATKIDPISHKPIIDLAGDSWTTDTGFVGSGAPDSVVDVKFRSVKTLQPRTGVPPDPTYPPGSNPPLYFQVEFTGSFAHSITFEPGYFNAIAVARLLMNQGQLTGVTANTSVQNPEYPDYTRYFISPDNWTSYDLSDDGNFIGRTTFKVPYVEYSPGKFGYDYELEMILHTFSTHSGASISGLRSMHLDGITFADGTTPESHGYEIVDALGILSPNVPLAAVPEPSALALAGMGFVVSLGYEWRRRL